MHMCVFTCKCAYCGCLCKYFYLWLCCVFPCCHLLTKTPQESGTLLLLSVSLDGVVTALYVGITFATDSKTLMNKDRFVQNKKPNHDLSGPTYQA